MKVTSLLILAVACASHDKVEDTIRTKLMAELPAYRSCVKENGDEARESAKSIVAGFTIKSDGTVTNTRLLQSDLANEAAKTCIVGAIQAIKFEPPKNGGTVEVSQPINFFPK